MMIVVKMRGGAHSKEIREYEITSKGVVIGGRLMEYDRLITGIPRRVNRASPED
jgi:circadian clock protein KaiC